MKTTLIIDDQIMQRLKVEAAERRKTLSELVEGALRRMLDAPAAPSAKPLPPLPTYDLGGSNVDLADRDALYRLMEED